MQKHVKSRKGIAGSTMVIAGAAALASGAWQPAAKADIVGFGGSTMTGWQPNANTNAASALVPNVTGTGTSADVLQLTTPAGGEATSYWFTTPQSVNNFVTMFTYTDGGGGGADGITFTLQNSGINALGGGGGSLGYVGIPNAAGDAFNIYSGNSGSGTQFNGPIPTGGVPLTPTT